MAKKVSCTLCHAKVDPAKKLDHLAEVHNSRNHGSRVIAGSEVDLYFRKILPPPKRKKVSITLEEHRICMRFKDVEASAQKGKWAEEMDWYHFTIAFFMGAGLTRKRAEEFALLCYSSNWMKDPVFAKAV